MRCLCSWIHTFHLVCAYWELRFFMIPNKLELRLLLLSHFATLHIHLPHKFSNWLLFLFADESMRLWVIHIVDLDFPYRKAQTHFTNEIRSARFVISDSFYCVIRSLSVYWLKKKK